MLDLSIVMETFTRGFLRFYSHASKNQGPSLVDSPFIQKKKHSYSKDLRSLSNNYGKSPFLMGKSTINGKYAIAANNVLLSFGKNRFGPGAG